MRYIAMFHESKAQIEQLKRKFKSLDTNNDGVLSQDEIQRALKVDVGDLGASQLKIVL